MCVGIIPQVCVVVYNYKLKIDTYLMRMPYIYNDDCICSHMIVQ